MRLLIIHSLQSVGRIVASTYRAIRDRKQAQPFMRHLPEKEDLFGPIFQKKLFYRVRRLLAINNLSRPRIMPPTHGRTGHADATFWHLSGVSDVLMANLATIHGTAIQACVWDPHR